ncbi:hypothetical protein, partial [Archangium sp.]|uniref:hypothetical protein n=1 Tax=Archangium sp. TaxID=1872627 RepID=UPI002ED9F5E4
MKHAFTHGLLLTAACALTLTFLACENKLPLPSARSGDVRASADELVQTDLVATSQLDGGTHSYTATLPPTAGVGTITQTLEATWDWMLHSPSAPPIHPQGWSIDYYAGGTKLTSAPTTPSGWASVSRIVSTGSTTVDGLDGERQVLLSTISAPPVVVASSFSSGSVGDGWDVFFDPAYTKVFNIHHHSGPATVMCRKLVDGTACPGFPIDLTKTANRSTGKIDAESNTLWQPTVASGSLAWDCVDLTGSTRCAIPVVQSSITTTSGGEDYDNHVDPVVIGRKMYAIGYASDNTTRITCLDMATRAECPGVRLPQNGTAYGAGLEAVGTRLYVLPGSGASLDCYDSTTWTRCPGSWPQTVENSPVWGVRGADGVVHNVCANGRCFALDGSAHTLPPNFITALEADPVQEFIGKATSLGTKAAWTTNGGTVICWDMLTDARCSAAFPLPVDVVYAPTLDPENPDCLWTNGDDGVIRNYKISTGAPGCSGGPPRISFKATVAIPRLGCDPSSRGHQ